MIQAIVALLIFAWLHVIDYAMKPLLNEWGWPDA